MDEISFQMGHSQKENAVFDRTIGSPKEVVTGVMAWLSILECISMDGRALPLLVIYRGTVEGRNVKSVAKARVENLSQR
jgi:hypothetical protein